MSYLTYNGKPLLSADSKLLVIYPQILPIFNGGYEGTSDWINPGLYNIPDGWNPSIPSAFSTNNVEFDTLTGNGFTGNYARITRNANSWTAAIQSDFINLIYDRTYKIEFKYRTTATTDIVLYLQYNNNSLQNISGIGNKIDATTIATDFNNEFNLNTNLPVAIRFQINNSSSGPGTYIEFDEVRLTEIF